MSQEVVRKQKSLYWERLGFGSVWKKSPTQKIVYIGIFAALNIVINRLSLPFGAVQFSFSSFFAALTGVIIGPLFGFVSGYVGDLIGFFASASPYVYTPWIGISTGMFAVVFGGVVYGLPARTKGWLYIKLGIACILSFLLCSVLINSVYLHYVYNPTMKFWDFLIVRFFVQGQIWNSLVNYALLFIAVPALNSIKPLKLQLY